MRDGVINSGLQVGRYKVRRLLQQASHKACMEAQISSTRPTASMPCRLRRTCLPVSQPDGAKPGLCLGYHVHAHGHWLGVLGCRARPFLARVVGWTMAPSMPVTLVFEALRMAIQARRPAAGLIVHSDRGGPVCEQAVSVPAR